MSSLVGHVLSAVGFVIIGLWHLFNHIKLHSIRPESYNSMLWFPTARIRYLELYLLMFGSSISVGMELFFVPSKHQPLDTDGTIPSYHLHNFEHSIMSATIFTYAFFAILIDQAGPRSPIQAKVQKGLAQLVVAVVFAQQLFLFHFHSADHMGVEGRYHLLLQIPISISLATTLIGVARPRSFLISFVRSACIFFEGVWLVVMGVMLWTPALAPKGCFLKLEEGHRVMRCHTQKALHRAKALVNLEFGSYVIGITAFSLSLYLILDRIYGDRSVKYQCLSTGKEVELCREAGESEDV